MAEPRKRRIVRRVLWTFAAVAVLPVWYLAAWLTVSRAEHDRIINFATAQKVRPAFVPLLSYCESDLPGSGVLRRTWWLVNPPVIVKGIVYNPMVGQVTDIVCIGSTLQPPPPADVDAAIKTALVNP